MRTLSIALALAALFVATRSRADGTCSPVDPQQIVCIEFESRSVAAGDVERLAVRMHDRRMDAHRRGTTVIARMRASEAAPLLHAEFVECAADGGGASVVMRHAQVPARYRRDVTAVALVDCSRD